MGSWATMSVAQKRHKTLMKKLRRRRNPAKQRAENQAYKKKNPDRVYNWNASRRQTGFTAALRDTALELQANRCGICASDLAAMPPRRVHADHDHLTGLPRGVLCSDCNTGLGLFKDDRERLLAAVRYLASPPLSLI